MILKNEKNQELNNKINDLIELVEKLDENNDINLSENTKKINEVIMQNLQINNEITQMHKTLKNQMNALNTSENEKKLKIENELLKKEIKKRDVFINSTPQLSQTALGRSTVDGKITYRNWWAGYTDEYNGVLEDFWFTQFIKHRFPNENYKLNFFSVWNKHYNIKEEMEGKKIFYTSECVNVRFPHITELYGPYALNHVDLGLGYDYLNHPNYLRFPYWLCMTVSPEQTYEDIENTFESWDDLNFEKSKNVVAINRHDKWNTRTLIANDIKQYSDIAFAGIWNKNTNDLIEKYNNNKIEYMKQFKFNLCAENVIDDGYVTEKIFDAIKSDCIPLYMGCGEHIEPKVINEKAILRWYPEKDNSDTVELFKNLLTDEKTYKEFKDQKILLDSASKYVISKISELEKRIEKLIYDN